MKEIGKKIAGALIALAGVLELVVGIYGGTLFIIWMGICFCVIGSLIFFGKRK